MDGSKMLKMIMFFWVAGMFVSCLSPNSSADSSAREGIYQNQQFGFQLSIPSVWKSYSVQEAVACPTIRREYAQDYYLIKSPTANPAETAFIIDKASLSADYFTSSPLDQVRAQMAQRGMSVDEAFLANNPGIAQEQQQYEAALAQYEQLNINGFKVYRKNYVVAKGFRREDNYFVSKGNLIEVYYYVSDTAAAQSLMTQMRELVDRTLAVY
ncbi:MAG: hypothetical protein HQL17_00970 [Candidatus Omnitrophica bacterium]|nr:hypothetical protein [Candidatus Omnitrophota bacterium]